MICAPFGQWENMVNRERIGIEIFLANLADWAEHLQLCVPSVTVDWAAVGIAAEIPCLLCFQFSDVALKVSLFAEFVGLGLAVLFLILFTIEFALF